MIACRTHLKYFIATIVLLLATCTLVTAKSLKITDNFSSEFFNEYLEYFEDSSSIYTIDLIKNKAFYQLESPIINFKYSKSTYWFKGRIINSSNHSIDINIKNRNHYLEHFDIYIISGDKLLNSYNNGSCSPFRKKSILVTINPNSKYDIYFKVKSDSPIRVPIYLYSNKQLEIFNSKNNIYTGVIIGVLLFLFFLTLLISFSIKEKVYLFYGICIISIGFFLIGYDDFLPHKVLFNKPNFLLNLSVKSMSVFQVSYLFFSLYFFSFKKKFISLRNLLYILITLSIIHLTIFIYNYTLGNKLVYFLSPTIAIIVFAISIYSFVWLKMKFMRFYVLGTAFIIVGFFLHVGANIGVISNYNMSFYALKTSYLLQLSIFAYALSDRLILLSRNFTKMLNEKVEERTTKLEQTLKNLKTRQQQLIQSEKMASIGILTSGLAHELNNPLNYIAGGLELLRSATENQNEKDSDLNQACQFIENGFNRSSTIVSSILEFSHRSDESLLPKRINEILDRIITVLKPKISNEIEIVTDYTYTGFVSIYPSKIHQLFINIIDNAISFAKLSYEKPRIEIKSYKKNNFLEVTIFNNGPQIPEADLNSIFDPFYTTREVGEGTGLGLSAALTIIQEHNGEIKVLNRDIGVTFIVRLPLKE